MICLISSSCQRTTSLPHNGPEPVHCNICGNEKNSSFFRFGLTEIRQKHDSYHFPLEEDLEPQSRAAKTKESQGTSQQLLNMHLEPHAVSLAETAWEGRQWSYPQVTLKNAFHLARRACH